MNIVKPYAKILDLEDDEQGIELLRKIEWCGRISHRSEEAQSLTSWERFIRCVVLDHGDWSIVEHASVTVDMLTDRGITHEVVRHRLFAFTQESTRFVNYEKKMPPSFICPVVQADYPEAYFQWLSGITESEDRYKAMLKAGVAPQIARSVFPNALAARVIITGNLRNWRHFLLMRTTREAHPQIREICIPLLEEFKRKIPILYEDIEPMARQVENARKGR